VAAQIEQRKCEAFSLQITSL